MQVLTSVRFCLNKEEITLATSSERGCVCRRRGIPGHLWAESMAQAFWVTHMKISWGACGELEERCKRYRNRLEAGGQALNQQQLSMCLFSSVSSKAKTTWFYSPFNTTLQSKRVENLAVHIRKVWVKISSEASVST